MLKAGETCQTYVTKSYKVTIHSYNSITIYTVIFRENNFSLTVRPSSGRRCRYCGGCTYDVRAKGRGAATGDFLFGTMKPSNRVKSINLKDGVSNPSNRDVRDLHPIFYLPCYAGSRIYSIPATTFLISLAVRVSCIGIWN